MVYTLDMNTVTLTKRGLKTRPCNIGMEKKGLKKYDYNIDMNKRDLKKLTKGQLIKLLLKQQAQKPRNSVKQMVNEHEGIILPPPEQFRDGYKPIPPPRTGKWESAKPKPIPRKSVKQMVKEYEDIIQPPEQFRDGYKQRTDRPLKMQNARRPLKPTRKPPPVPQVEDIIQPPEQFRDGYKQRTDRPLKMQNARRKPKPTRKPPSVPQVEDIIQPPEQFRDAYKPRTDRPLKMQNAQRPPKPTRKPPPVPQVEEHITNVSVPKIKELNKALKGHAKSYEIELQDNLNPLNHFTKTRPQTESHLEDLLKAMKGFKFIETLEVTFEKDTIDSKTGKRVSIYKTAFFNGKAKIVTKVDDVEPELNMSRQEILNVIDKWVSEGSGWVINRIDSHYLNVTLYKPLSGSSYIKLPAKLGNSRKGLINLKNEDNECFRWCHIRHLNPQEKNPQRIKKEDKIMIEKLDYSGISNSQYRKKTTIRLKRKMG